MEITIKAYTVIIIFLCNSKMATSIDLSSLEAALPLAGPQPGEQHGAVRTIRLEVRVLSWNVKGPGAPGPRYALVPRVVENIDPDILPLQEPSTEKLIKEIVKAAEASDVASDEASDKALRSYVEVRAGEKTVSRAV